MPSAPSLAEIKRTLRRHLPALRERYRVDTLGLFGSYVRHEQRPASDLDVLVTFTETPGLLTFIELENELSDLLGSRSTSSSKTPSSRASANASGAR